MSLSKQRATRFRAEWLRREIDGVNVREWLAADHEDPLKAVCVRCKKTFHLGNSGFGAVTAHAKGQKHSMLSQKPSLGVLRSFFLCDNDSSVPKGRDEQEAKVMCAELRMALFFSRT